MKKILFILGLLSSSLSFASLERIVFCKVDAIGLSIEVFTQDYKSGLVRLAVLEDIEEDISNGAILCHSKISVDFSENHDDGKLVIKGGEDCLNQTFDFYLNKKKVLIDGDEAICSTGDSPYLPEISYNLNL